ncbi:hypothetical protein KP78_29140 [Jeotgalibacillus soli]|uniref:Uncharacterized protein n=1 Tax=Jeotgalibacillus soli TaxID=889306 RepID=A0A0C2R536_9BACL|nr:hypothetical protein KP78_29140 [Jeotgalibacillus soli]
MAGEERRKLHLHEDPDHKWVHSSVCKNKFLIIYGKGLTSC